MAEFSDTDGTKKSDRFNLDEFIGNYRYSLVGILLGLILVGFGVIYYKQGLFGSGDKIEIIDPAAGNSVKSEQIIVEISGSVEKPGVYKLASGSRVEDLLIASGGVSANADRVWIERNINRAAKLSDGQKLYIYKVGEQSGGVSANNPVGIKTDQAVLGSSGTSLVNINSASLQELDSLPGIGQVYGQSIIDHRPYSTVDDLVTKGALKQNVLEKIKDKIAI